MKKKLIFSLVVVAMLVCVLAACGGNNTPTCAHSWEQVSTTATCEDAGTAQFTCTLCAATKQEAVAATGHTFERTEIVKATCVSGGYDLYECKNCDASEQRNKTSIDSSLTAHDFQDDIKDPTCDRSGYIDKLCSRCGKGTGTREIVSALGHTYERADFDGVTGVERKEPTCTENGEITYNCTQEGCTASVTYSYDEVLEFDEELAATLQAFGHNPTVDFQLVEPSCLTPGYKVNMCANDGCDYTEQVAQYEALGHTYERADATESTYVYEVELDPTCINVGYEWVVCTDCDHNTKDDETPNVDAYRRTIAATGEHVYDVSKGTTPPTCIDQGYTTYGCSVDAGCEATEKRDYADANGHEWVLTESLLTNGVPTCKTNGDFPYHCANCSETSINENGESNTGALHTGYTKGNFTGGVAPTCISRGKYYCSDCETVVDAYANDTLADAHGNHKFDLADDPTAPTCATYGYTVYGCSADKACVATEKRDYTERAAHVFTERTEDGTISCVNCAKSYIDETTVIYTDSKELCSHAAGETCETCGIGVVITGTKTPDPAYDLVADTALTTEFEDGVALIELAGAAGTTYTVTVYDKNGNAITKYDAVVGGEVVASFNITTTASGSAIIDITEVEKNVGSITVTASAAATVVFYTSTK